ncbi:MAG: hypothetical protein ACKVN9_01280 [Methylophilaceae bacterium]
MKLRIETFSNLKGGGAFFKAIGHPLVAAKAQAFFADIASKGRVAVYDPLGLALELVSLYDLSALDIRATFVQKIESLGEVLLGHGALPITRLPEFQVNTLMVVAFDAKRLIDHIRHLVPPSCQVVSLDEIRLPETMLTNKRRYLDKLNFATNFAFMRESQGQHTRLTTCDYWTGWGAATPPVIWFILFDEHGTELAQWQHTLPARGASMTVDSVEVSQRFGLGEFTGTLFMHVIGVAGHEVVKYALDTYADSAEQLSCTHDANAWPSELYAGLPAPDAGERIVLWVQNSHPIPIPRGEIGLNLMGKDEIRWLDVAIPPFGTYALDVASLFPEARWPKHFEVQAGKYFVRPRYEITTKNGRSRIAHANVERNDLQIDPAIPALSALMGKGYVLPAPILPVGQWRNWVLPTPMSTAQANLPLSAKIYDSAGNEVAAHFFGRMPRDNCTLLDVNALLAGIDMSYGHIEMMYDFRDGGSADGWMHGIFRYQEIASSHIAETSFGAHVFNTPLTYKDEPQSYAATPPGLSTRLFLRLGDVNMGHETDAFCHLIYAASTPWHPLSNTSLELFNSMGEMVATHTINIPCSGSQHWRYSQIFSAAERQKAGAGAYVLIRDATCRLFGYHGLIRDGVAVALDHMFGF